MKKLIALYLLAATFNFPVAAQEKPASETGTAPPDALRLFQEFQRTLGKRINFANDTGNILTRLEEARAVERDYPPETKPQEYGSLTSILFGYAAEIGNYADALRYDDFTQPKYPLAASNGEALAGFKPVPAVETVAKAAEKAQVVMINEAHHVPQHRAFTTELLKALKKKGYKYFAAEMLVNGANEPNKPDTELGKRGYPTKRSGLYAAEPLAGDMLRAAARLGYVIVPYDAGLSADDQPVGPEARERGAAANLKRQIFDRDPNAKVLMHVGYAHNSEAENVYRRGVKSVAGYLKDLTGINPLTVDQTAMSERSAPEYEQPLYRFVADRKDFTSPTVFQNSKGEFFKGKAGQDILLFSPRSVYRNGRPHWLAFGGARREYVLPTDVCGAEKHCLVRARYANESADAAPIDQIEARADRKNLLLLPKGNFVIEAEDAKGGKLKNWRVKK